MNREQWKVKESNRRLIESRANASGFDLTPKVAPYKQLGRKGVEKLESKIKNRTIEKDEWKRLQWHKRMTTRRNRGVENFWIQEKRRIELGQPTTRNWSQDQRNDILNDKTPSFNDKTIAAHHSYSVLKYPQLADKGEIIYPDTKKEHKRRWHGGPGNGGYKTSLPGEPFNPLIPEEF